MGPGPGYDRQIAGGGFRGAETLTGRSWEGECDDLREE